MPLTQVPQLEERFNTPRDRELRALVSQAECDEFMAALAVDDARIAFIRQLAQGTPEWREGFYVDGTGAPVPEDHPGASFVPTRKYRITGSRAGELAGIGSPKPFEEVLHDFLYGDFQGNAATRYGQAHEDEAVALATCHLADRETRGADGPHPFSQPCEGVYMTHEGLVVCKERPWAALSSDGTLCRVDGRAVSNEAKCPFSQRPYGCISNRYYCQITMACALQGLTESVFEVFTPERLFLYRFPLWQAFWDEFLLPSLEQCFFRALLPRYILLRRGDLQSGELYPGDLAVPRSLHPVEARAAKRSAQEAGRGAEQWALWERAFKVMRTELLGPEAPAAIAPQEDAVPGTAPVPPPVAGSDVVVALDRHELPPFMAQLAPDALFGLFAEELRPLRRYGGPQDV